MNRPHLPALFTFGFCLGLISPAPAQTVASVAGRVVTLSAGTNAGVAVGMTGKLCGRQVAGGREGTYCPARFRVTLVTSATATLEITEGDAGGVVRGMTARFDQRLERPAAAKPTPAAVADDPRALADAGDAAMGQKRWTAAAGYWERLLRLVPGDPYATKRLAEAKGGAAREAEARREEEAARERAAEEARRRQEGAKQLAYLRDAMARAARAGDAALEREYAKKVLALDPGDRAASQVRARDRNAAAAASAAAEGRNDENGVKRAWRAYEAAWGGDPESRAMREKALAPLEEARRLAERKREEEERRRLEVLGRITWIRIPAGTFFMGCTPGDGECEKDEKPRHVVTLTKPYDLAETETTNAQYEKCAREGPCRGEVDRSKPDHPVVNVSWEDAAGFCRWAGGRLPTEAEWERAARGGEDGKKYPWGNSISHDDANYTGTGGRDAWEKTSPVKSFAANGFGLFDMAGNVWEWVGDWYHKDYYSRSPPTDPVGPATGQGRVLRGGSCFYNPRLLRVSLRLGYSPDYRLDFLGFRCARDASP